MRTVIMKVWNKTVTIQNVPDYVTEDQLLEWAKKRLIYEGISKQNQVAG